MKNHLMTAWRVLTLCALVFIAFYLFKIHAELYSVSKNASRIESDMSDTFTVHVDDTVEVEGSVSIDR